MIDKIIEYSAENRFFTIVIVLFIAAWGFWAMKNTPLDAIPDLSDVQVIVFTEWPGRSPDLVEDQITYPITTTMIAAPKVKFVRGQSFFGLSFVYIIFDEQIDSFDIQMQMIQTDPCIETLLCFLADRDTLANRRPVFQGVDSGFSE